MTYDNLTIDQLKEELKICANRLEILAGTTKLWADRFKELAEALDTLNAQKPEIRSSDP